MDKINDADVEITENEFLNTEKEISMALKKMLEAMNNENIILENTENVNTNPINKLSMKKNIPKLKKILLLIFFLISSNLAFSQNADNNFALRDENWCNGDIGFNALYSVDRLPVNSHCYYQYKGTDNNWYTFFELYKWEDSGGTRHIETFSFDGCSNFWYVEEGGDYYYKLIFNGFHNGIRIYQYNMPAEFRALEGTSFANAESNGSEYKINATCSRPNPPTNVAASQAEFCDKIVISWDASASVTCGGSSGITYRIFRDGNQVGTSSGTSYEDYTSGSHTYKLDATIGLAESVWSNTATGSTMGAGNPPSGVSATEDLCDGKVKITWEWNTDNPSSGFDIGRNHTWIANIPGDKREYIDATATPGVTYVYDVGAADECGNWHYSSEANGYSVPDPQTASTPIDIPDNINNVINISWSNVAYAEQVILIRASEDGTANFELPAGTTSYIDSDAGGCKTYTYKVKTVNSCKTNISASSDGARIDPNLTTTFDASKKLICSKGYYNDKITLKWNYNNQNIIERFKIYRKEYGSADAATVIASIDPTSTYSDETAEAGIYYEYTIVGEVSCESDVIVSSINVYSQDIGFRVPEAIVSGSVTYENGTGVKGVQVIAETEDDFGGHSLNLSSSSSMIIVPQNNFDFSTGFSFQAWVKPTSTIATTLFSKGTQYKIQHSANNIIFTAGLQNVTLNFPQKTDTFFCVNAIRRADSLVIFVIYDELTVYRTSALVTSTTTSNTSNIIIGDPTNSFTGYIEDIRIWNKGLSNEDVMNTSIRYIAGNESELKVYFRLNEMFNNTVYDISRKGAKFNENHGFIFNCSLSTIIPFSRQLSVKGITDASGNYLITGIPYTVGSIYKFVPIFQVHEFDPIQKSLFIGPGSNTHSGINFVDIAAFKVTGNIKYKDTYFPVQGVYFYIDGQLQIQENGTPIETDNMGNYEIYVPIGWHHVEVAKYGHVFADNGRYPVSGNWNFQQPIPGLNFTDSTLIKVVGKVAGGPVQEEKPIGLGKTVNNVGFAEISLKTQKEKDLMVGNSNISGSWTNDMYEDDILTNKGITNYSILNNSPKFINIFPDRITGEFVAYLLPEKYIITSAIAGNYTFDESFLTTVDLSSKFPFKTEIDSVIIDITYSASGDTILNLRIDSVNYQHNLEFIYREIPSINVTNKDGEPTFWETEMVAKDGLPVPLINSDGTLKTLYPVFKQSGKYNLKISVFEQYINSDNGGIIDNVPVKGGKVEIQNFLSLNKDKEEYTINKFGEVDYTFIGGLPNITTGGIGDYIKTMAIVAKTGKLGVISTPWEPGGNTFRGYIIGGLATGNNFITTGPNKISMVLRDPPGSNSYAYYEEGSSFTKTSSTNYSSESTIGGNVKIDLGAQTITWAGVGAGTMVINSQIADATTGLDITETYEDDSTVVSTTTLTQRWQTSGTEDYVGRGGDLFIGYSTNIVYGISIQVDLIPTDMPQGSGFVGNPFENNGKTYDIGIAKGIRINPAFGTAFQYSQNHIEKYLVPNLKMLRNNFLINQPDVYQCVICDQNDENFALNNTTGSQTSTGWTGGDSYNITIPSNWPSDSTFVDSVAFFNEQIRSWEETLGLNEKAKLSAVLDKNLSFDAGSIYENSQSNENSTEVSHTYNFLINDYVSGQLGVDILGMGTVWSANVTEKSGSTDVNGTTSTNSTTFGYVLNDGNTADYVSVDVKKTEAQSSPVFITRGGQTMCPYEGGEFTKYYQPGTPLSIATMQREIPNISCENPIAVNIQEDAQAIFNIQIANTSETNDGQWMVLSMDETSNQFGAMIQMDGSPIYDGRMILLPAGQTINKIITVNKTLADVYDYENLILILHSACQFDPTDFQDDIADSVRISAYFLPVCTNVELNNPDNQWVINTNTDTTLNIGISGYDINNAVFDKILMQYKSTSTSNWSTDMVFYVDEAAYNAANEPKTFINGLSNLDYIFDLKDMQDRNYDVKVMSTCIDGTINDSEIATGIKDVKRPLIFGSPQPADGILTPNDEVMLTFDETINQGGLLPYNFTVKGVLNGAELKHESCLFFDGVEDYASVVSGVNLDNKSWTIEFWTRRGDLTAGTIFSQNEIELGFNSANEFYMKSGSQSITSISTFTDTETWFHFVVTYDDIAQIYNMYINDLIEREGVVATSPFNGNGKMYIGRNVDGTDYFNGFVHELRIWEEALGFGTAYSLMYQSLAGNEIGLGGYWTMAEAQGAVAEDKARNHHAILFGAEWRVFPTGYARTFDGTDDYVRINTGSSVVISDEMDFTLELYFKGGTQANTVLFSNGKGDGSDYTPPFQHIWVVGVNANGEIYAKNNGVFITIPDEDFLDNKWHHLGVVMNRQANTSIFIDGQVKAYKQSSLLGGLVGAEMVIGAKRGETPGNITYTNSFIGNIDEVRIWNLSRTAKQLKMDMNSKLKGDEMGLLAYYPFDKYNDLGIALIPTLEDATGNAVDAIAVNGGENNIDVPNIKDARPVQEIAFDWVVNDDKIIINVNEQASAIEKCILEFTVERVEDLHDNRMSSPVTWTAYIKQNSVIWNDAQLNFTKEVYTEMSFDVDILNIGGTEQNYTISGLPAWLSVSEPTGSLAPDSYKTVTFTVDPVVNIGDYTFSLFLTSDFGYDEKLNINLNVFETEPNWTVDPANFQYSMSVIGQLKIDGVFSTNKNDMVAAFVNGECRGKAYSQYIQEYDMFEVFLNIYSNVQSGEEVTFKIWNASEGYEHINVTPVLNYMYNEVIGMPSDPQIIESSNSYSIDQALNQGWTWISFNLQNDNLSDVQDVMSTITANSGDQIKGQSVYANYSSTYGWDGSLIDNGGFTNTAMYMVKLASEDVLKYWGSKLKADEVEIPINTGWNWISYTPNTNMTVDDAFGNYQPLNGDIVKSQFEFAMYDEGLGWLGSLTYMVPGKGYMFKTTNPAGTLTFPVASMKSVEIKGNGYNPVKGTTWTLNEPDFEFNMSIVAKLQLEPNQSISDNHAIGAFVGEECRGICETVKVENEELYFLTVYSNSNENITFKLIDMDKGLIYEINESSTFTANNVIGVLNQPFVMTLGEVSTDIFNINESLNYSISSYPNPFNSKMSITYSIPQNGNVNIEIFDVLGKKITTLVSENKLKGTYNVDFSNSGLSSGVYLVKIKSGDYFETLNVVKY